MNLFYDHILNYLNYLFNILYNVTFHPIKKRMLNQNNFMKLNAKMVLISLI